MKTGLLLLATLSSSMFAQGAQNGNLAANERPEPYVLPIKDTHGFIWTREWTDPTRALQVIQKKDSQKAGIRFISHWINDENGYTITRIKDLPVEEMTKAIIAKKLRKNQEDQVSYSDCHAGEYRNFAFNLLANYMRARLGNEQEIETARMASNIISEVPVQRIYEDACKGALQSLSSYEAQLQHQECSQEESQRLLRPYRKRLERWQKTPSKGVIYSDNYHDQSETED